MMIICTLYIVRKRHRDNTNAPSKVSKLLEP